MNKNLKIILLFLSINNCLTIKAQNLVPNPSFEEYSICPTSVCQMSYSLYWDSYSPDPDYFNTCSAYANIKPPNCWAGFQYPHTGNAFAGFCTYHTVWANEREILGAQLLAPLSLGQKVFISFYVNLGGQNDAILATNKIGIRFSTVPYSDLNRAPINNYAHFYCDSIISDTLNWTLISGSYVADSAYTYISIGNFFRDTLTDTINAPYHSFSFYYIDDICVSTDPDFCNDWLDVRQHIVNKNVSVFPNPANDKFYIDLNDNSSKETSVNVFNVTGHKVLAEKFINQNFVEMDVSSLAKGIYLLKVQFDNEVENRKLIIK